ncbi:MAG: hypothetical protein HY918_01345 [Candidatus Doudnabacteria bacterium]|nr:hypothetical protein [Candidatus Doudnabacteria bacterium]
MTTNFHQPNVVQNNKVLYKDLSYKIGGIFFEVHKELGSFAREKQYCDLFEQKLKEQAVKYKRELRLGDSGNIVDFEIDDKIIIDLKLSRF